MKKNPSEQPALNRPSNNFQLNGLKSPVCHTPVLRFVSLLKLCVRHFLFETHLDQEG